MHRLGRPIFVLAVFGLLLNPQWGRADSSVAHQLSQLASAQEPKPTTVNLPEALRDSDPMIRWEYLRNIKSADLTPEILRALWHDTHPKVRLLALGHREYRALLLDECTLIEPHTELFDDARIRRELIGLIDEFPADGVTKRCVLSLLRQWPEETQPVVAKLLFDEDYSVQAAAAIHSLGEYLDTNPFNNWPDVLTKWEQGSSEQRQAIIYWIDFMPDALAQSPPTWETVFKMMLKAYSSSDLPLRRQIARIAITYGNKSPSDIYSEILALVARDADPLIQRFVLKEISNFPPETQHRLVAQVLGGANEQLHMALVEGIGWSAPIDILDRTASFCDAPNMNVRAKVLGSLQLGGLDGKRCWAQRMAFLKELLTKGDADSLLPEAKWFPKMDALRNDEFMALIKQFLASDNGFYRMWGVRAMPYIRNDLEMLSRMTHDRSQLVRLVAIEAIGDRNSDEARKLLESILSRSNPKERSSAIANLATIGMKKSWSAIAGRLTDSDKDVRKQAIFSLQALGATEAGPQLVTMLSDVDLYIRKVAVDAISNLGLAEYAPQIKGVLENPLKDVSWSASLNLEEYETIATDVGRVPAIAALTHLDYPNAEHVILRVMKDIENKKGIKDFIKQRLHAAGVTYLAKFATKQSIPYLVTVVRQFGYQANEEFLSRDTTEMVKKAINALVRLQAEEAIPVLIPALASNHEIAQVALDALVKLKAVDAWPALVKASQQNGLDVIEALVDLGRIEEAVPELLSENQPRAHRLSSANNLFLFYPLQSLAVLETASLDEERSITEAWFTLFFVQGNALHILDPDSQERKLISKALAISSNVDRQVVLDRLTKRLATSSVIDDGMEVAGLVNLLSDNSAMEKLLSRDSGTLSKMEGFAVMTIAARGSMPTSYEPQLAALVGGLNIADGNFLGRIGIFSKDAISNEMLNLSPKQLTAALETAPRFGPAWLKAYVNALSRAGEDKADVFAAAVKRRWVTDGVDPARFVADTRALLKELKHPQPELVWLVVDILKEIGEIGEAIRWLEAIHPDATASNSTWLMLHWQTAEVQWRNKDFDLALAVIADIETRRIPEMTADSKKSVNLPIDAYTLLLKGAILNDKGNKAEAVRILFAAEDKLKLSGAGSGDGEDIRERVASMIRAYRGQAQKDSAAADSKAALSYFDRAGKSESTLIERDAETRALETQIRISLGDGDFEEAQRLTERLALRRYSVQPGTGLASRSPERQAALDTVKQLKSDIREVEEKIRAMTPPPGAAKDKAGGRNDPAGESSAGQAPTDGAAGADGASESGLLSILQKKRSAAQRKLKQYFTELKRSRPEVASLVGAEPTELAHIQKTLAADQALIQYLVLDDRGWAFIATHDNLDVVDLKVSRAELVNMIGRYRIALQQQTGSARGKIRTIHGAAMDASAGQWLADRLVAPVLKHAEGARQLIVVPQGDLHSIPFAALPYRSGYLVESYVVSQLPSASLWNLTSQERGGVGQLLALGNPVPPSKEWSDLPGAEAEVKVIAEKFPARAVETHVRGAATGKLLTERSLTGQALHLALHGEAGSVNNTRLVMSDGYLGVQEIWGLALENSPLVVLSACETAVGEQLPGDEVTSLTNGFLFAGARSVIGSLWKVPDEPTMQLFSSFYDYLLQGKSPAEALALAQRPLIKDGLAPMAWGAFVVAGR